MGRTVAPEVNRNQMLGLEMLMGSANAELDKGMIQIALTCLRKVSPTLSCVEPSVLYLWPLDHTCSRSWKCTK